MNKCIRSRREIAASTEDSSFFVSLDEDMEWPLIAAGSHKRLPPTNPTLSQTARELRNIALALQVSIEAFDSWLEGHAEYYDKVDPYTASIYRRIQTAFRGHMSDIEPPS